MAGTNGKVVADKPRKRSPSSLEARIEALEARQDKQQTDIDTLAWLLAGLLHEMRKAIAQQLLQSPQVQQRLQEELLARLQGGQQ